MQQLEGLVQHIHQHAAGSVGLLGVAVREQSVVSLRQQILSAKVGQTVRVICDGIDDESGLYLCRTAADAPEVDGNVCVSSEEPLYPGAFYDILVDDSDLYDLYGTVEK
jgi:ribosomal protein S12 methylthiotransferase